MEGASDVYGNFVLIQLDNESSGGDGGVWVTINVVVVALNMKEGWKIHSPVWCIHLSPT